MESRNYINVDTLPQEKNESYGTLIVTVLKPNNEIQFFEYNTNGSLKAVAEYKNNKKHGRWEIYDFDGFLIYTFQYKNGKKTGIWKMYDKNGNVVNKKNYN